MPIIEMMNSYLTKMSINIGDNGYGGEDKNCWDQGFFGTLAKQGIKPKG